jgi:hypothetical protein
MIDQLQLIIIIIIIIIIIDVSGQKYREKQEI